MLKNMTPRERKTIVFLRLCFDYDDNGGYAFPCDEYGNPLNLSDEAKKSLEWCKAHPEKFVRFNEVVAIRARPTRNPHAEPAVWWGDGDP